MFENMEGKREQQEKQKERLLQIDKLIKTLEKHYKIRKVIDNSRTDNTLLLKVELIESPERSLITIQDFNRKFENLGAVFAWNNRGDIVVDLLELGFKTYDRTWKEDFFFAIEGNNV